MLLISSRSINFQAICLNMYLKETLKIRCCRFWSMKNQRLRPSWGAFSAFFQSLPNAGTLTDYVTSTGNTAPLGSVQFTSGFAAVDLAQSWTETLEAYLDPANGVPTGAGTPGGPGLVTQLGSAFFNTVGASADNDITNAGTGGGPYSVTAVYRIKAPTLASI